jgi:ABC-type sugar transport system ATPase subunit
MQRGLKVGERKAAETTVDEIVSLMVGAEVVREMGVIPKALEEAKGTSGSPSEL